MVMITSAALRRIAPSARVEIVDAIVNAADEFAAAGISTTARRMRHFIAQTAVESAGFRHLEEGLTYSAERLTQVWPSRFPTLASAKPYARNPQKLANKVYGGRMGNTKPNDGYEFRGGGILQTTGREGYRKAGYENNPEALRTPAGGVAAAIKFWTDNKLNAIADRDDIESLTRRINGGLNGLAERRNFYKLAVKHIEDVQLTASASMAASVSVAASVPASDVSLTPNKIKAYQEQLAKLGYEQIGPADGVMGSKTIAAISQFQAENGIEVNGRFDSETVDHLYEATPRITNYPDSKDRGSKISKHAGALKKGVLSVMGTATVGASADPLSQIEAAQGYISRIKAVIAPLSFVKEFIGSHWLIATAVVGIAAYLLIDKILHADADNYASGKTA